MEIQLIVKLEKEASSPDILLLWWENVIIHIEIYNVSDECDAPWDCAVHTQGSCRCSCIVLLLKGCSLHITPLSTAFAVSLSN